MTSAWVVSGKGREVVTSGASMVTASLVVSEDVAPYSDVASADCGHPIPSGGGVIGGIVAAERAAVDGASSFIFGAAGVSVSDDADGEGVGGSGMNEGGDIEAAAHESAIDAAELLAVEIDVGLPVNAVEVEPEVLVGWMAGAVNSSRYQKLAQKKESEIAYWLSPKLGSGMASSLR